MQLRRLGIAVGVLLLAGVVAGLAIAQDGKESSGLSSTDLSAQAALASGQPGDRTPPCPPELIVDQLKDADIAFGPCIPIPEGVSPQDRAELLAAAPIVEGAAERDESTDEGPLCSAISARTKDGEIVAELPCGAKVTDEEFLKKDGRSCLEVTSVDVGADVRNPKTDVFCAK